jgi:hypothetical protein
MTTTSQDRPEQENPPISESKPGWLAKTDEALQNLLALSPDWNSYGARTIQPEVVRTASALLHHLAHDDIPQPAVVPTVRGGVQLEWHTRGIDLEIEIESPEQWHVSFEDSADGAEWEIDLLPADLPRLAELTARLSRPQ